LPPRPGRRQLRRAGPAQAQPGGQPGSWSIRSYLKLAFSHATVRAIQYYRRPALGGREIRDWYRRKKRKKPDGRIVHEPVARALVAKEIARIVYHVLRKQEDFNGTFKGAALSRAKQEQWPLLPSPASITDG
jgi:transposase